VADAHHGAGLMRGLLVALGFLTRIPVPARVFDDARAQRTSLAWYPMVGVVVGALVTGLFVILPREHALLSAALTLLAWVVLTGGLHLDGLADSADAWVGGFGDRARTLEIMKDPRSGPAGVTVIVLLLLLKFAALASLPAANAWLLWLSPLLARAALTAAFVTTPYVRSGGLGSALKDAPRIACVFALACGIAACLAFGLRGALALGAALLVFVLWRRACLRRLGGFTGDTAGALAEMVEAGVLVVLVYVA
jgi:adenosylcobinamide-GDP ribazoletransferase